MKLALATCCDLPEWEHDDAPLHAALEALGATLAHPVWNDPDVDWSSFDACLIRTTWDYHEHRDAFVAWAQHVDAVSRLFNPLDLVVWNTHKSYLRDLAARGVPVIPTRWCAAGEVPDVAEVLTRSGWSRAFLKPAVGATAYETLRFEAGAVGVAEARAHLERAGREVAFLLQPYLDRVETDGESSVIVIDGEPTHAVRKVPVPGDYRVQEDFGASDVAIPISAELRALAARALAALPGDVRPLYARLDVLPGADGRWLLNELELVEPTFFFRNAPEAAVALARALVARLDCG